PGSNQDNYKSTLQTVAQRVSANNPQYVLLDEIGPDHAKSFEVCVVINNKRYPSAWSNTKKQAEQAAALHALMEMGYATKDDQGGIVLRETPAEKNGTDDQVESAEVEPASDI